MKRWKQVAWITSLFTSQAVLAQTSTLSSPSTSGSGTAFVQQALQDQLAEIELSKIAQNNSTNPAVINFAKATIRDQTQANRMLRELATKRGIPAVPAPEPENAARAKILRSKTGTYLDAYYVQDMARIDDRMILLYRSEISADDRDIASYAKSALPQEEQHENLAQSLTHSTAPRAT